MDRTERFYRIDQLLNDRKVVPFSTLVEKLEVSRATIKRDIEEAFTDRVVGKNSKATKAKARA